MKKHLSELQVYSGIAILFVTLIHSNAFFLLSILHLKTYVQVGFVFTLVDKVVHVAVPMFIFISGYKYEMHDKNEIYTKLMYKKFTKIIKPFLIVSIWWILFEWGKLCVENIILNDPVNIYYVFINCIKDLFNTFLGDNFAYQLWYIPMYTLVVFSYPIIIKVLKNSRIRMIILYIIAIIITVIQIKTKLLASPYMQPINFIYYFYLYELGVQLYCNKIKKKYRKITIICYLFLLPVVSLIKDPLISNLSTYLIFTPIAVVAMYYIAVYLKNSKILLTLGKYSFAIYLFHEPVFVSKISRLLVSHGLYSSKVMIPFIAVGSIILSICFYKILIKTSLGKYVFNIKDDFN
ncbi:acyltransferase family protein [Clostridium estertheticum]|uniref:acyltransferase family protein n=1 Tax=Clostridium estertheticum TaxID=238834 RepID=UPI001CF4A143|nr:acyltransferase [Clostridium estertheticum]MCB2353248.1 acyltransferase [Clostridium estertheticum]WAG41599.1 acyltransferase [Clostridium estertheticum]